MTRTKPSRFMDYLKNKYSSTLSATMSNQSTATDTNTPVPVEWLEHKYNLLNYQALTQTMQTVVSEIDCRTWLRVPHTAVQR
ncbi:MAG: hypothetical protein Kow00121_54120 [Elainellaceae cyanobacterium]